MKIIVLAVSLSIVLTGCHITSGRHFPSTVQSRATHRVLHLMVWCEHRMKKDLSATEPFLENLMMLTPRECSTFAVMSHNVTIGGDLDSHDEDWAWTQLYMAAVMQMGSHHEVEWKEALRATKYAINSDGSTSLPWDWSVEAVKRNPLLLQEQRDKHVQ